MEVLANALLPRRISQIYADTKRSYEHIVRTHITNPQLSSLHLKLRIQKDRLIAWGLEWADANAAQSGDIDDSLDRAGISDLVASIMSSIRELLDEAERIQPNPQQRLPGPFPPEKPGQIQVYNNQWTPVDLARLTDIVKDITISIDTLCDLSRSQQAQRQSNAPRDEKPTSLASKAKALDAQSRKSSTPGTPNSDHFPLLKDSSSLISSTRIEPQNLVFLETTNAPGSLPPSYDAVATSPSNRAFALLKAKFDSGKKTPIPERLVLIDYGNDFDSDLSQGKLPSLKRFESLVRALQTANADPEDNYTGCLRVLGWFADRRRSKFVFVYEVPQPRLTASVLSGALRRPQTLMSYLQHGGDTDSANMPCLEDRYRLAINLASNLLHTHAKGITHRNINSNSVVFMEDGVSSSEGKPWKEGVIRKPFLVSWDQSAEDASVTQSEMLVSSIYRHPKVERGSRSSFRPAFDIYSLGLILLEIGLWMPLHKFWKTKYTMVDFQKRLQTVYTKKMAAKCGNAYMSAVHYCLHVADSTESESSPTRQPGGESQQAKLQTDFYWKVLKPLERCCMVDESQEPILVPASSAAPERFSADPNSLRGLGRPSSSLSQVSDPPESELPEPGPVPELRLKTDSPFNAGLKSDLLVWSHKVPNATRAYYETVMMPRLQKMFARAIDRWESYEIDIFMAGETPETARPTLCMVCKSIMRAWKILEKVNSDQNLFDIRVARGQIHYSKNGRKRRKPKTVPSKNSPAANKSSQAPSKYHQKPACGASIGAFVDEQHLEAVTFGGIVLVDGEPYGMSVHHMLEDQDLDHGLDYILDSPELAPNMSSSTDESQFLEDDELDADFFDQDFDDDEERFNLGDTMGTPPGRGRELVVTQPALDDVDPDFFPNEEDMSDDHLSSHGLGYVHASSGLKQVKHGSISHEVDWALFKVAEGRLCPQNTLPGGEDYCTGATATTQPRNVVRADELGDREVHAIGSKSGLAAGKIWAYMTMTKMPGRVFSSPVWRFNGGFGGMLRNILVSDPLLTSYPVGGDSGAWVIDNTSGGVCGHVTAWSEFHQNGTISPMEVLLHDMEQTLGKPVALPVPDDVVPAQSYKQQLAAFEPISINPAADAFVAETRRGKGREASFDSNYGSDDNEGTENENDNADSEPERADTSCTSLSPPLTSASALPDKEMSALSLDGVAEQWRISQEQKGQNVNKDMGATVHRELHRLEARC